jgi:hypothetical protein
VLANTDHSTINFLLTNSATLGGSGSVGRIDATNCSGCAVSPGGLNTAGLLQSSELNLSGSSIFRAQVHGTNAGAFDQLKVSGAVRLNGAQLAVTTSFTPEPGAVFMLIQNDSALPIAGTFNGLPEGSFLTINSAAYQISYIGGDGNDVTLTRIFAAPASQLFAPMLSGGVPTLSGQGVANAPYVLEATSDLNPPILWQPVQTNFSDATGAYLFVDTNATNFPARFYRVQSP